LITRTLENIGLGLLILKDCMALYRAVLRGQNSLDLKEFVENLRETGLTVLVGLTLVAAVVGLIVGVEAELLIKKINAPGLFLGMIGLSIIKEFAPFLVGMFVAGRSGIGLAVRIGSMILNREADGLIVSGINPVQYVVAPMLLAMLLMSFALAVWTDIVVVSVTAVWLWYEAGIPWAMFADSLNNVLDVSDLILSTIKPMVFALFIALIAAVNGCRVNRQIESVSRAATRTMISAIAAILLVDLFFILSSGD